MEEEEQDVMPKWNWKEEAELEGLGSEEFMVGGGDGGGEWSEKWRPEVRDGCVEFGIVGGTDESSGNAGAHIHWASSFP